MSGEPKVRQGNIILKVHGAAGVMMFLHTGVACSLCPSRRTSGYPVLGRLHAGTGGSAEHAGSGVPARADAGADTEADGAGIRARAKDSSLPLRPPGPAADTG